MKVSASEREDFLAGQQILKSEIKAVKKDLSKAKKAIKKEQSRIKKAQTALGAHYYRDFVRAAADPAACARLCEGIAAAEETLQSRIAERDALELRLTAAKWALADRKRDFLAGPIPEISRE